MLKEDRESLQRILSEAVVALCHSGLPYDSDLRIDGLLGITIDKDDVFIVAINEVLQNSDTASTKAKRLLGPGSYTRAYTSNKLQQSRRRKQVCPRPLARDENEENVENTEKKEQPDPGAIPPQILNISFQSFGVPSDMLSEGSVSVDTTPPFIPTDCSSILSGTSAGLSHLDEEMSQMSAEQVRKTLEDSAAAVTDVRLEDGSVESQLSTHPSLDQTSDSAQQPVSQQLVGHLMSEHPSSVARASHFHAPGHGPATTQVTSVHHFQTSQLDVVPPMDADKQMVHHSLPITASLDTANDVEVDRMVNSIAADSLMDRPTRKRGRLTPLYSHVADASDSFGELDDEVTEFSLGKCKSSEFLDEDLSCKNRKLPGKIVLRKSGLRGRKTTQQDSLILPDPNEAVNPEQAEMIRLLNDVVGRGYQEKQEKRRKRGIYNVYSHDLRTRIGKFASENGIGTAIEKFREELGKTISDSTVRCMRRQYKAAQAKGQDGVGIPKRDRGRPLLLKEYDKEVAEYVEKLQKNSNTPVTYHIIMDTARGILLHRDKSKLKEFGGTIEISKGWAESFVKRLQKRYNWAAELNKGKAKLNKTPTKVEAAPATDHLSSSVVALQGASSSVCSAANMHFSTGMVTQPMTQMQVSTNNSTADLVSSGHGSLNYLYGNMYPIPTILSPGQANADEQEQGYYDMR